MEWDAVESSGRGTLHSFTVIHYPQFPGYEFPIIAALVDLEEGVRMMSSIFGCESEKVEIGMELLGVIHKDEDGFALPVFQPVEETR
ncbi:MAG: OB-fold domain-containing protein, partial [Myxococcota bacterium]